MIRTVTLETFYQVTGLLTIADQHYRMLEEIENSIRDVLKVTPEDDDIPGVGGAGHIGDAIFSRYSAKTLLVEKLGLTLDTLKESQHNRPMGKSAGTSGSVTKKKPATAKQTMAKAKNATAKPSASAGKATAKKPATKKKTAK
jgi:hypothetical protein